MENGKEQGSYDTIKRNAARHVRRRRRAISGMRAEPGTSPGQLRRSPLAKPTRITVAGYGPEGYEEQECVNVTEIEALAKRWPVLWVHISGLADVEKIGQIGQAFALDALSLEDVLDSTSHTKLEFYGGGIFTVLRSAASHEPFENEQVSLFLRQGAVISFQEGEAPCFAEVRERLKRGSGRIRGEGADYLYYALIDEVIDRYFPVLDRLNDRLSAIEDRMIADGGDNRGVILQIHNVKSDLLLLHRLILPVSDLMGQLIREDTPLLGKTARHYLRDCLDHSKQANELTQFYRDTATGLLNTFLAYEGHKTNEIVKLLTMVSAVFIPTNFIAGVYGMNFRHMPELEWEYGYGFALSLMGAVALFMLSFFVRKRWIRWGNR